MAQDRHTVADILDTKRGRALEDYRKAAARLGKLAVRRMGDMRELRMAGSDIYFRQAELAALVELQIEFMATGQKWDLDRFLERVALCMNKTADKFQGQESAIHLPGRSN